MKITLLIILIILTATAYADRVCSVHDGDTFKLCSGESIRIRAIDAPELRQPSGIQSRDYLKSLVSGKDVKSVCNGTSYKRLTCWIFLDGQDLGALMVKSGWAWDYPQYSYGLYSILQDEARSHHLGIWQGQPQRPSCFRHPDRCSK